MKTTKLNPCDVDENYKAYPLWCWWKLQELTLVMLMKTTRLTPCDVDENYKAY